MDLIEYEDLMERLRKKRKEVGLQQNEVAHRAGIDPGFLSKMERHGKDAKYRTVYRVWETIDHEATSDRETADKLKATPIEWAETSETHREVKQRMIQEKLSQLPVRDESDNNVGRITESVLMANDDMERTIRELMDAPLVEVPPNMSREAVQGILGDDEPAILVTEDNEATGIITKTDLI